MVQLHRCEDPFGEVNVVLRRDGRVDVTATILKVPRIEGAVTGLALDASASMKPAYGIGGGTGILAGASGARNSVEPVARNMAGVLSAFAADGAVHLIYWACGPDGSAIEPIGRVTAAEAGSMHVKGPREQPWGRGTRLLPPLRHFAEEAFGSRSWAMAVFVTDGEIDDLAEVKTYTCSLARQIAAKEREFLKLVLIGVGRQVNERQMEELDDLPGEIGIRGEDGSLIDLWDHKIADHMEKIDEIFSELVAADVIVSPGGVIRAEDGELVREYPEGLPAFLAFTLPRGSRSFTLEYADISVTQDLADGLARMPKSEWITE